MKRGLRTQTGARAIIISCAFLLLAGSLVTETMAAPASTASMRINWSDCHGDYECGTLRVPLDHDEPNGTQIPIALVRLPASDPDARLGSLVLNPGGPGGSGVDFTVFASPFLFTDEVRERYDLVGFDPRGTNRSAALRCFGNDKQWGQFISPFLFPVTAEEEAGWAANDQAIADACERRGGSIADHMSTANVARDMDLLRAALGDTHLNYAGYSYGSYLGVTYANLFPENVGAFIVDGVLDPIAWSTGAPGEEALPFSTRLRSGDGAQASLHEFFRLCELGGETCPFSGDAADRYAALAEELRTDPVTITFPDGFEMTFGYSELVGFTLFHLYDSFSWPDLAVLLSDLEAGAESSQVSTGLEAARHRPVFAPARVFPRYQNFIEGFSGVACSDSDNPDSFAAYSAAAAAEDATGYFGRVWTWFTSICVPWPGADTDRYMGPFDAETANPVLVVGTEFDPATPYHGAEKVAALLPNSALLTVHGWGHTSLFLSSCADAAIADYLIEGELPAPGTVCEQDWVPFTS